MIFLSIALWIAPALANSEVKALADRLSTLREQVSDLELGLIEGSHSQKNVKLQMKKIQKLLKLQKVEKELGKKRVVELENTVNSLETRRVSLQEKLVLQQKMIRKYLMAIESTREASRSIFVLDQEKIEAPRRRVLSNLVDRGLKELEVLKVDLADAAELESKIQEERQQLAYLFQDLREQESVLELNRQLQIDLLKKRRNERIAQLENYHKLKSAETQVEHLISAFNARVELEKSVETERTVSKAMMQGLFAQSKGKLPLPVSGGKVVSSFGRAFDARSGLYIFKKGIDISVAPAQTVRAISSGKVAFSGELPNYGRVVILDHGDHFYSLCAHLGTILKQTHHSVAAGDPIGVTADSADPLYFEIRARNVAVNPLQWVLN